MSVETFEEYRPLLLSLAYRLMGTMMDAEDIVQEAFLRYQRAASEQIQSPRAYLSTIVTRLCLNQLTSARQKRESYTGPWLPEPVLTGSDISPLEPADKVSQLDSLSMAFMVLLEQLSPAERAVFILRAVFDYEYVEIGEMLDKSPAACRQLYSRSRRHLRDRRPRFESRPEEHARLLSNFMRSVSDGDLDPLTQLLAADVTVWTDGGGKTFAALRPIQGRAQAARFLIGSRRFLADGQQSVSLVEVNGRPSVVVQVDGRVVLWIDAELGDGGIQTLYVIANPDKLQHLNRVIADV